MTRAEFLNRAIKHQVELREQARRKIITLSIESCEYKTLQDCINEHEKNITAAARLINNN